MMPLLLPWGNKARKLEFLMKDALKKQCDYVITTGGPQSNHARMTAAAARKCGLIPVLVLEGNDPGHRQGNLLLDHILGAEIVFSGERHAEAVMDDIEKDLLAAGKKPYRVPLGGSSPLGALGYVECVKEMIEQGRSLGITPSAFYVAAGSCGTLAGMALGKSIFQYYPDLIGVAVSANAGQKREQTIRLIMEMAALINYPANLEQAGSLFNIDDGFIGQGYGIPTDECLQAMILLAQTEGIITDLVYSAKALSALIDHVKSGRYGKDESIIFVHTGGVPANFSYSSVILKGGV